MAVVTVTPSSIVATAQLRLGAYSLQRFLRSLTTGQKTTASAQMSAALDVVCFPWSGGYSNGTSGTQQWSTGDFAPVTGSTSSFTWNNSTGRPAVGDNITRMNEIEAGRLALDPSRPLKYVFNLMDIPVAMLGGQTRASAAYFNQPSAVTWGTIGGPIASAIVDRYPGQVLAFEYGIELKGVSGNGTTQSQLDIYAAGFTQFATYMRAHHPEVELWYPHYNFFARDGLTARRNSINAMIAGSSGAAALATNDIAIVNRLMTQVDPSLVDRWSLDSSIVDFGTSDTWRGDYATVVSKVSMIYHLGRVVREMMTTNWGAGNEKPFVDIETYFDVNQTDQDWASDDQSAVLQTGLLMNAMLGGHTYSMRWEPQGGTPGSESPNGNIASWFTNTGSVSTWKAWPQARDLVNTLSPGTSLYATSSDDGSILALAGQPTTGSPKIYLLNTSAAAISTSVTSPNGNLTAVSIPAYSHLVQTLPAGVTASAGRATSISATALDASVVTRRAKLTLRF